MRTVLCIIRGCLLRGQYLVRDSKRSLPIALVSRCACLIIVFGTSAAIAQVFSDTFFQANDGAVSTEVAVEKPKVEPGEQADEVPIAGMPDQSTGLIFGPPHTAVLRQLLTQFTQVATATRAPPAMLTGYVSCAGGPIAGATLRAELLGTGRLYGTVSDEDGHYALPIVYAGTYAVWAELAGFAGDILRVEIPEGVNSTRLDLSLRIGSATSGTAAAQSATPHFTQPTTFHGPVSTGSSGQPLRQFSAGISIESAREVVVVMGKPVQSSARKNSDPLLFGGSRGRLFHGSVSYTAANSALDAMPYALRNNPTPKRDYASNSYELSLGGPLAFSRAAARDARTSFSFSYSRSGTGNAFTDVAVVPTERERNGDFSGTVVTSGPGGNQPVQIYDPSTGQPFPQSRIPSGRISPVAMALLRYFPVPNLPGPGLNYYHTGTTENTSSSFNFALTRTFAGNHNGSKTRGKHQLRWQVGYRTAANDLLNIFPELGGESNSNSWNTSVSHTYSKGALNSSLRLQASRSNTIIASDVADPAAAALGIEGVSHNPFDAGVPSIGLSHYRGLSGVSPRLRNDRNYQLVENLKWTNGRHTLHWGAGVQRTEFSTRSSEGSQGAFVFTGYATASSNGTNAPGTGWDFADFLLGLPQRAAATYFPGLFSFSSNSWHAFVNHDWRVTGRLTLNAGIRYEHVSPYRETHGRMADLDIAPDFAAVATVTAGQFGPFSGYFPRTIIRPNTNNVMPRIGLAVRIADGTVMRASYGVHYNTTMFPQLAQQLALQPPFSVSQTALASGDHVLQFVTAISTASADPVKNTFASKRDLRLGYAQVWLLQLERELPRGVALGVSYTGTKGTHLGMLRAPNRTAEGLRLPDVPPFLWQSDEGSSILHAANVRFEKRFGMGMWFSSNYTFSRSIDNLPTNAGVPQDEQNLRAERALSDFDERHRLELSYSYELPLGKGKTWLREGVGAALLGNWSWTGTLRAGSGNPIAPVLAGDINDVRRGTVASLRPNLTGAPIQLAHPSAAAYFNPLAFSAPPAGEYGNAGRNILTGPGMLEVDMEVRKHFAFEGRHALDFGMQATNALNRPQWNSIDNNVTSPSFGQVTGVAPMRRIQLNFRYSF